MNDRETFVTAVQTALACGRRARAAREQILIVRTDVIRARYDPTIRLTPERLLFFRRMRRALAEIL